MITIYCDGGARGNPGPAASSFVVYSNNTNVHKDSRYLGVATNNIAEYTAVVMALEYLDENKFDEDALLILDSQLVVKQLQGVYKVKNENLRKLFLKAKNLESKFSKKIAYKWASRDNNKIADLLVNRELDKNQKRD